MSLHTRDHASSVTDDELSAFSDGELSPARTREVAGILRRDEQAANKVFEYWTREREIFQQLRAELEPGAFDRMGADWTKMNVTDEETAGKIGSVFGRVWLHGAAACALLVLGVWLGSVSQTSAPELAYQTIEPAAEVNVPIIEDEVAHAEPLTLMPVASKSAGASATGVPDNLQGQEQAGVALQQANPLARLPDSNTQLPNNPAIAARDILPKSTFPVSERQEMLFIGADGAEMLLTQMPAAPTAQDNLPDAGVNPHGGAVQWVSGERLFVLSGNQDAARLFAVALSIQQTMSASHAIPQPADMDMQPGSADFLASAAKRFPDDEPAPQRTGELSQM